MSKTGPKGLPRWVLLVVVAVAVASATACVALLMGMGDEEPTKETRTAVSYSWWGNDKRHAYTLAGLDRFEESHTDIQVSPYYGVWDGFEQRNAVVMRSHDASDVMQINYAWLSEYSPDGTGYYDLYQLSDVIDLSQFSDRDLSFGTVDGHLNALPIAYNMPVFWYNADLYAKYGLEVPRTWDDLFAAAQVMRADGVYPLSAVKKHVWMLVVAWYEQTTGQSAFDESGACQVGEEGLKQMLAFYQQLVGQGVLAPPGQNESGLSTGTAAGVLCWISDSERYCKPLTDQGTQVALGPNLSVSEGNLTGWYMKPATMLAISSFTPCPRQAGELVDYLLSDPDYALMQGTEKGVPVSRSAHDALEGADKLGSLERQADDQMKAGMDQLGTMPTGLEDSSTIDAFEDACERLVYGQDSLDGCAHQLAVEIGTAS